MADLNYAALPRATTLLLLRRGRLRRRLHAQRERFGVGYFDLVALLHDLELIGIVRGKRNDIAPRPFQQIGRASCRERV